MAYSPVPKNHGNGVTLNISDTFSDQTCKIANTDDTLALVTEVFEKKRLPFFVSSLFHFFIPFVFPLQACAASMSLISWGTSSRLC